MSIDVKYKTSATAIGGRDGRTSTEDGKIDLRLAVPKELGGPGGHGTNPEQLFAAGYAACFLGAIKVAGQQLKVRIPSDAAVTATVGIGPRSEGGLASQPNWRFVFQRSTSRRHGRWSILHTRYVPIPTPHGTT